MDDAIEVVESRGPEGFGFFVKVQSSGQVYRVSPARDPRQPRFWCLLVTRCSAAGVADPGERPWLGAGGMTREELPAMLATIREDVGGWLAQDACQELRTWLLSAVPVPPPPSLAGRRATGREQPSVVVAPEAALSGADSGEAHGAG